MWPQSSSAPSAYWPESFLSQRFTGDKDGDGWHLEYNNSWLQLKLNFLKPFIREGIAL